ncbi:hypothetical protein ABZV64_03965 [Streptomyces sp. NPDC004959]|uniref:hypothetical protein n=1 Tax=unclassified Streptomyces TaxID=2593676 RepID=UPI0004C65847|nr:hypothetical protein [Streptomyces sp. NRRL F-5630]
MGTVRGRRLGRWGALAGAAALGCGLLGTGSAHASEEVPETVEGVDMGTQGPFAESGPDAEATRAAEETTAAPSCIGTTVAYGSTVCFVPHGDVVWVLDTKKDGMSAAGGVYTDYGRASRVCVNKAGVNHWVRCDYDYWEKGNIQLRALRYDSGTQKFYVPDAWSDWLPVDGKY